MKMTTRHQTSSKLQDVWETCRNMRIDKLEFVITHGDLWIKRLNYYSPNIVVSGYIVNGYVFRHCEHAFEALVICFIPDGNHR